MKRNESLPELLSPAGSFECLVAAVCAGADAVYVGGKRFGARAYAKNFDSEELKRAVNYCHLHGVRLYVTLNTLIYDKEMAEAVEYAKELYRIGVDALIIADLGAVRAIKKCVPDLPLHASTQMSIHNSLGTDMAERLGCERAVVARELSFADIKRITEKSGIEIEVFLHGALCVCHSGQCLFSSLVGGRSGNRGECAQPCRLPYNGKYPLSLKDLSLSEHITELIDSGVSSLKIEGRMKSPSYVYTVTKIYRRLLDERRNSTEEERGELLRAFSRDGFTDGYFTGRLFSRMTGMRSEEEKRASAAKEESPVPERVRVSAKCEMRLGMPSSLTLFDGKRSVSVTGEVPREAENSPLTDEGVKERLSKMGNTLLSLSAEDIELSLDEGINLSPSAINALRRAAAEKFESSEREYIDIPFEKTSDFTRGRPLNTAVFFKGEELEKLPPFDKMPTKLDIIFVSAMENERLFEKANGIYLPPIIFEGEIERVKERATAAKSRGVKYALVSNLGAIEIARSAGLIPVGDFRLNVTNSISASVYRELSLEHLILSPELTLPMARDVGGSVISYGRIPLMITERCFMKENFGCERCGVCALVDRLGEKFPMMREFEHRNLIFNSKITYVGDRKEELRKYRIGSVHFLFTTEGASDIMRALSAFSLGESLGDGVRRVGKRKNTKR